ncbi:MAG: nitroreductase family deazaflavin-dependent oxidoreductase [Acidimicrobiales bacterium]|nr:nitroreductase family deazaflavin-dependent oxidoreductase [Acidimicrobiales bacterium]
MPPPPFVVKAATSLHRAVIKISGGRVGWTMGKMPVIELFTTGRRSGQQRSTMLTTPWQDGASLTVVASAGGSDQHPAWFLNLQADPAVLVRNEEGTTQMNARILSGDERAARFDEIAAKYPNYAGYQENTSRVIPVVVLDPA